MLLALSFWKLDTTTYQRFANMLEGKKPLIVLLDLLLVFQSWWIVPPKLLNTSKTLTSTIVSTMHRQERLHSASGVPLFQDPKAAIVSLPQIPPEPEPLHDWYNSQEVVETLDGFNSFLKEHWEEEA